jgi:hypothetical protein
MGMVNMPEKTETVWSTYRFTDEEARQNAKDLAQKMQDKESLEDQLTSIKSDFKAKIDLADAQIRDLRNKVASGTEQRQYRCRIVLNFKKKIREYFDLNTNVLIETRPLQAEDYQTSIPLDEGAQS